MDISIIAYLYHGADLIFEAARIGGIVVVCVRNCGRLSEGFILNFIQTFL